MASLGPSKPAAGGMPPSPAPDTTDKNSSNDGGEGNRKRKADEAFLDDNDEAQTAQNACIFLDLPQELLSIIFTFQYHKDRILVATTCCDLLKAVEVFSEKKLEEMSQRADDTWWARISDQSTIETRNPKPLNLPHRYLLSKALRSHLYTLGGRRTMEGGCVCQDLHSTPDGRNLISIAAPSGDVRLWDIATKQSKVIYEGAREEYAADDCLVSKELVVTAFEHIIVVQKLSGEVVHRVETPTQSPVHTIAAVKNKLFFKCFENFDSISYVDLVTGRVHENAVVWMAAGHAAEDFALLAVSGFLLVIRSYVPDAFDEDGIHVFDTQENPSQKCFLPGYYHSFASPTDSCNTVVAARTGSVDVLDFSNGQLTRRFSFDRLQRPAFTRQNDILHVNKSLAFVKSADHLSGVVEVYNILNGKLVQTFTASGFVIVAATNGSEIFFGLNTSRDNGQFDRCIQAYPLPMV